MLHPSYSDLMKVVNEGTEDDTPVVNSRYSIVMATAKRARQIIAGDTTATDAERAKPLSTAVRELNEGSLRIISAEQDSSDDLRIDFDEIIPALTDDAEGAANAEAAGEVD